MRLQNDEKYWHSVRAWIDLHCIARCRNTGTSHHKLHAIGSEIAVERLLLIDCIYSFHEATALDRQILPGHIISFLFGYQNLDSSSEVVTRVWVQSW